FAGPRGLLPVAASTCRATSRVAWPLHRASNRIDSTTKEANAAVRADAAIPRREPGKPPAKRVRPPDRNVRNAPAAVPIARDDWRGTWRRPDRLSCEARPAEPPPGGSISPDGPD